MRILIVEDEPAIVGALRNGLAAHGFSCLIADNGDEAVLQAATEGTLDLVLLDLTLPGLDGQNVLERIRAARPRLPVLVLTGRDNLESKVKALNAGADDYMTKPFAFEELLARIRALLRRADQPSATWLEAGALKLDLLSRRAWLGDEEIELSTREFALLEYFMRHPRHLLSRQQILSAIWDYAFDSGSNLVDVYVGYLRRKIDQPGEPTMITTVRGSGYRFDPPRNEI